MSAQKLEYTVDYATARSTILERVYSVLEKPIKEKAPKDPLIQQQLREYLQLAHQTCVAYLDRGLGGEGSQGSKCFKKCAEKDCGRCSTFWVGFTGKKADRDTLKKMEELMKFSKSAIKDFTKQTKAEELLSNSEKASYENDIMKINNPVIWKDGRETRCQNSNCPYNLKNNGVRQLGGKRYCNDCQHAAEETAPRHLECIAQHKDIACRHRMTIRQLSSLVDQGGHHLMKLQSQRALEDQKRKQERRKERTSNNTQGSPRHLMEDKHLYRKCSNCEVSMGYVAPTEASNS